MKFVWPVLEKMLKERETKIAEGLYAAERGHKELELAQKQAIKEIREARQKATLTIEQAHQQASRIIEDAKHEANQKKEQIVALGKTELEQAKSVAIEALRHNLVELTILSTEKILKRSLDANEQKALLDVKSVGTQHG